MRKIISVLGLAAALFFSPSALAKSAKGKRAKAKTAKTARPRVSEEIPMSPRPTALPPDAPPGTLAPGVIHLWNVCDACGQPESAWYSSSTNALFVSNVDGEPLGRDGKGSLQKLDPSGKVLRADFTTGLNAPKGIRGRGGKLYVADIDELVVISESTGKIERKIPFPGAKFLNDVAIDGKGTVYVSDTAGSAIYSWTAKKGVQTLVSGKYLESPNGLWVDGNTLWIAAWGFQEADGSVAKLGRLMQMDLKSEEVKVVGDLPLGNLDGLEKLDSEHFLVSDWVAGKVYSISRQGEVQELISGVKGAADLGWIASKRLLILPRMGENAISAYHLP